LQQFLRDRLNDAATNFLKINYAYIESEAPETAGLRIIQITGTVTIKGKRQLTKTLEALEVNNSSDVAGMIGSLVSFTGDDTGKKRLKKIEEAFEAPQLKKTGSLLSLPDRPQYALELRSSSIPTAIHAPIPITELRKLPFADIPQKHNYEIALYNFDPATDVVVNIEIDGLSAINSFNVDCDAQGKPIQYPGYLVEHASNGQPGIHVIPGWMHTVAPSPEKKDNVFQFVVNEMGKGAATALKSKGEVGMIHTRWFQARTKNNPNARVGGETGVGRPMQVDYKLEPVDIVPNPIANISIRYLHP